MYIKMIMETLHNLKKLFQLIIYLKCMAYFLDRVPARISRKHDSICI